MRQLMFVVFVFAMQRVVKEVEKTLNLGVSSAPSKKSGAAAGGGGGEEQFGGWRGMLEGGRGGRKAKQPQNLVPTVKPEPSWFDKVVMQSPPQPCIVLSPFLLMKLCLCGAVLCKG